MQNLKLKTLVVFIGLIFGHSAFACDTNPWSAWISGPSECVPIGSVQTYVGTTDLTSSGCTVHEWTVTDGVILTVNGVAQPPGVTMVCLWESADCAFQAGLSGECSTGVLTSATTSTITVRWGGGAKEGKVKFAVKEKGTINLSVSKELVVKYPPAATSISRTGNTCSTNKTYTAVFPPTCPGITGFSWTLNGSPVGTTSSPSINLTVPLNQSATVGVSALYPGGRSLIFTQSFAPSSSASANIEGSNFVCKGGTNDFYLSGVILGSVTWSVSSPASIVYQNGTDVGIFLPEGNYTEGIVLIASGVSNCNVSFYAAKNLSISDLPCQFLVSNDDIETRSSNAGQEQEQEQNTPSEIKVYPTLLTSGQDIQVNLPEMDEQEPSYVVTILGMDGKIQQENKYMPGLVNVSTATLPPGNYILKAQSKDTSKVFRFVIVD